MSLVIIPLEACCFANFFALFQFHLAHDRDNRGEKSDGRDRSNDNNGDSKKNNTGGFWNIHLSPNSISSVPFGPGHLTVWEHARSPGR